MLDLDDVCDGQPQAKLELARLRDKCNSLEFEKTDLECKVIDLQQQIRSLHAFAHEANRAAAHYREALEDIADQGGTFTDGKYPSAYAKGHRARVALGIQMTYTDNLTH